MAWYSKVGEFFGSMGSGVIAPIAKAISEPIVAYNERRKEKQKAEHEMQMAEYAFKTQLIMNRESHNQAWEIEALKGPRKRGPMQWVSFIVLGAPFVVAWFNPALVALYFTQSLAVIPLWYQQMFVAIIGVIWGIANLKNAAEGINRAMMQRRNVDVSKLLEVPAEKIIRPAAVKKMIEPVEDVVEVVEEILSHDQLIEKYPELEGDK